MTVFQNRHRGGQWRYDFRHAGKRYQGPCVDGVTKEAARTKAEAKQCEALARNAARVGEKAGRSISRPGTFTIGQAIVAHIEGQVGSSPVHVANVKAYAREILAFFGTDTPVAEIDQERADAFRRHTAARKVKGKSGRTIAPASVNHRLNCLRAALAHAHRIKDPITGLPMLPFPPAVSPVPEPKRQPTPMGDAELFARLAKAPPWVREAAELARYFGLRRTEALEVELGNIDTERRAIRFDGTRTKSGRDEFAFPVGEGWAILFRLARQARARGQVRLITWPGPAAMADFLAGKRVAPEAWRPIKSIRRAWRGTAGKAKVAAPLRFHDIRARYITEVAKVVSSATTQEAARHQDAATTARYTAIASREVARALESVPGPKKPALAAVRRVR